MTVKTVARKIFDGMRVKNVVTWNSILSMRMRAADLEAAREMPVRDVVSWNLITSGYVKAGDMDGAAELSFHLHGGEKSYL